MRRFLAAAALSLLPLTAVAQSVPCGGTWSSFITDLKAEALRGGLPQDVADRFFSRLRQNDTVLSRDRGQGFFQRPFIDFSRQLISQGRLDRARQLQQQRSGLFQDV